MPIQSQLYTSPEVMCSFLQSEQPQQEQLHRYFRSEEVYKRVQRAIFASQVLVEHVSGSATPEELTTTIRAARMWIPQGAWATGKEGASFGKLPDAIFDKIIDQDWCDDFDILRPLAQEMVPLFQPSAGRVPAEELGRTMNNATQFKLRYRHRYQDEDRTRRTVGIISALTDAGAIDENVWGNVGISSFELTTPFATSEEVWRRFVLEQRDSYAPLDERTHMLTLGKYCAKVIQKAEQDDTRNQRNIRHIGNMLRLEKRSTLTFPLKSMVQLANRITVGMNQQGGFPSDKGVPAPKDLLSETSRASVGEALNRVLLTTRQPDNNLQAYTDSIHVDIVNELALFGANLKG